jgi:hypothetical protein
VYVEDYININLKINCPKLNTFCFIEGKGYGKLNVFNLSLEHPETIVYLNVDIDSKNLSKLKLFKNVEILKTSRNNLIDKNVLSQFKKLKEFHFINVPGSLRRRDLNFLKELSESIRIFICGMQLTNENINNFNDETTERFYLTNFDFLQDELPFVHMIRFDYVARTMKRVPDDFFKKFPNIHQVSTGVCNQGDFLSFLKRINNLQALHLKDPHFNQSFYDQLPTFCSLIYFYLKENDDLQLNYDFIGEFKGLKRLDLCYYIKNVESVKSLIISFSKLYYLKNLIFKHKEDIYIINKCSSSYKLCYFHRGVILVFGGLDKIMQYFSSNTER